MKFLASLMGFLLAFQMTCLPLPADAAVDYKQSSGMTGQVEVNKVGALLLAGGGLATLAGTAIEISTKGSTSSPALKGQLFNMSQSGSSISGHAFFDEGSGLSQLSPDGCSEFVKLIDGSKVNGPISSVTLDAVTCAGQSIPCSRIASISSARVFKFTTKIGESPRMTFQPSCVKLAGASKTYEAPTWKKIVIVGACVTALACAITLPIVIPLATRGGNHHNDLQNAYIYNTYLNASRVQPPPQPVRSGSGP